MTRPQQGRVAPEGDNVLAMVDEIVLQAQATVNGGPGLWRPATATVMGAYVLGACLLVAARIVARALVQRRRRRGR